MPQVGIDRRSWWRVTITFSDGHTTDHSIFALTAAGARGHVWRARVPYGFTDSAEVAGVEALPDHARNGTVHL
jgi:hypothetical protein